MNNCVRLLVWNLGYKILRTRYNIMGIIKKINILYGIYKIPKQRHKSVFKAVLHKQFSQNTSIHQYHVHKCKQGLQVFKALYAFYHLLSTHSNWIHTGLTLEPGGAHLINKEVKDLDLWMPPTEINAMTKTTTTTHRRRRKDRPRRSRSVCAR